jgi:hypothetical protein
MVIKFKPINENLYYDHEIKNCISDLSKLKFEYFDMEQKLTQINLQKINYDHIFTYIFETSFYQIEKQKLQKKIYNINIEILKKEKKILEFQIKKIDYEKYVNSSTTTETKIITVTAKYP